MQVLLRHAATEEESIGFGQEAILTFVRFMEAAHVAQQHHLLGEELGMENGGGDPVPGRGRPTSCVLKILLV